MDAVPEELQDLLRRLSLDTPGGATTVEDLDPAYIARIGQQYPDEIRALVGSLAVCAIAAKLADFAVSHP
jgi:hypothetical protein